MVKAATWNLWWRYGDWQVRQPVVTAELRSLNADILGLQEVWHTCEENFAEQLARELGYEFAFVASPAPEKWQQKLGAPTVGISNTILSRWPITRTAIIRIHRSDIILMSLSSLSLWVSIDVLTWPSQAPPEVNKVKSTVLSYISPVVGLEPGLSSAHDGPRTAPWSWDRNHKSVRGTYHMAVRHRTPADSRQPARL